MFIVWKCCFSKLWECLFYEKVVCPKSENVYAMRRLFVQTLRMFILQKVFLSKLWEYLLFENVVCQNSENVHSVKRLFDGTLRMFILWKVLLSKLRYVCYVKRLSKLWECLLCGKVVCQNSENVCFLNPGRWASPSPIISATQSAELRTEGGADMCSCKGGSISVTLKKGSFPHCPSPPPQHIAVQYFFVVWVVKYKWFI